MTTVGKPIGWTPQNEREHFVRCPVCDELLDMRDLGDVLDHLHDQEIPEAPNEH